MPLALVDERLFMGGEPGNTGKPKFGGGGDGQGGRGRRSRRYIVVAEAERKAHC